mgnify:CR=1 FL=1
MVLLVASMDDLRVLSGTARLSNLISTRPVLLLTVGEMIGLSDAPKVLLA